MKLFLVACTLMLTGCTISIPIGGRPRIQTSALETTYQVANGLDFATTMAIARSPKCYHESDKITTALVGSQPNTEKVYAAWAFYAVGHSVVSGWLERQADVTGDDGWHTVYKAWQVLTIGNSLRHTWHNYREGMRPFGVADWAKHACNDWFASHPQK